MTYPQTTSLIEYLLQDVVQEFPNDPRVVSLYCQRALVGIDPSDTLYIEKLSRVVDEYLQVLSKTLDVSIWTVYIHFLQSQQCHCKEYIDACLESVLQEASSKKIMNEEMYLVWFNVTNQVSKLKKGIQKFPKSILLWKVFVTKANDIAVYKKSLECQDVELWLLYLDHLKSINAKSLHQEYERCIGVFKGTEYESQVMIEYFQVLNDEQVHQKAKEWNLPKQVIEFIAKRLKETPFAEFWFEKLLFDNTDTRNND
jgi:hypothetical protein